MISMQWVNSAGGPLMCASPNEARIWRGTQGSSIGQPETDYDRACNEMDYLSTIPCGTSQALVLGDEPLQSAFFMKDQDVLIVRWVSCVSDAQAAEAMVTIPNDLPAVEEPLKFCLEEQGLVMFDSALDQIDPAGCTGIDVMPGNFTVLTQKYKKAGAYEFLLHRMIREDK